MPECRLKQSGKAYIYALIDSRDGQVRYVGKAISPRDRFISHLQGLKNQARKERWVNFLLRLGYAPCIKILEMVEENVWEERERWWIAYYRNKDIDLTNHTLGGDGVSGLDSESRDRLSQRRRNMFLIEDFRERMERVWKDPERCRKISQALKGRKHTSEHVSKLPQNRPGKHLSEATKDKLRQAMLGNQHLKGHFPSDESRQKISKSLRGNTHTLGRIMPEYERLQRSLALKGQPKSLEHREKIRKGQLKAWQDRQGVLRDG